jgi:hypothetical protein
MGKFIDDLASKEISKTQLGQQLAGLADAITARLRQSGDTSLDQYAEGQVLALQTCIRVDWA